MNRESFRYRQMSGKDRRRALLIASALFAIGGVFKLVGDISSDMHYAGLCLTFALFGVSLVALCKGLSAGSKP